MELLRARQLECAAGLLSISQIQIPKGNGTYIGQAQELDPALILGQVVIVLHATQCDHGLVLFPPLVSDHHRILTKLTSELGIGIALGGLTIDKGVLILELKVRKIPGVSWV